MAEKEYIEREALVERLKKEECDCEWLWTILDIPAADVSPVKHGHWKKGRGYERPTENGFVHDDKYICDCCRWGCCCDTKLDFRYCPNCGAKMDGGVKNGQSL